MDFQKIHSRFYVENSISKKREKTSFWCLECASELSFYRTINRCYSSYKPLCLRIRFGKGKVVETKYEKFDLSTTISTLLGLKMNTSDGEVIKELTGF